MSCLESCSRFSAVSVPSQTSVLSLLRAVATVVRSLQSRLSGGAKEIRTIGTTLFAASG